MNNPTGLQKFDAIIIEPDMSARNRLKQVCSSVVNFGKVFPVANAKEAAARLSGAQPIDVVFVSAVIGADQIGEFISQSKNTPAGLDSAYVLMMKSKDQDSSAVAQSVMIGCDGVLFEPYSVDQLVEITLLSARIRKERSQAREQAALKFLLNDVVNQLDLVAYSKQCGVEVGVAMRQLRQACQLISSLEGASRDLYFNLVVDVFEAAPIATRIAGAKKYSGASSRIRKKVSEKLTNELARLGDAKPA